MNIVDIVAEASATTVIVKYSAICAGGLALGTIIYIIGKSLAKRRRDKQASKAVESIDEGTGPSVAAFSVLGLAFLMVIIYNGGMVLQDFHIGGLLKDRISAEYNVQYTDKDSKRNDPTYALGKNFRKSVVGETFSTSEPIYLDGGVIVIHLVKETEGTIALYYTNKEAYELKAFPRN